jgi:negative regulator of sigma E activity
MNEQEQISQLSALFDGELAPQQAEMVIRRALKDPAMRSRWERYAVIGACLRGEPLAAGRGPNLADRVRARLAAETEQAERGLQVTVPAAMVSRARALFGRGALGGAIAAGVAVLSVFVVRSIAPAPGDAGTLVAQGAAVPVATSLVAAAAPTASRQDSVLPSYTTPGRDAPVQQRRVDDPQLVNYLMAHSEVAPAAFRFSYDLAKEGVEMTEAEIGALH